MARNPFQRATIVPGEVLAGLSLGKGEKVLAGTMTRDGSWLLGTRDALLVARPAMEALKRVDPVETRIPWERVERADWSRDDDRLRVLEVGRFGVVRPSYTFEIDEPGVMLELIRERVTASVVLQRRVSVEDKRGLSVIARRPPRGEREITWAYEYDEGVDPADPAVIEAAEQGLRDAAEELGL